MAAMQSSLGHFEIKSLAFLPLIRNFEHHDERVVSAFVSIVGPGPYGVPRYTYIEDVEGRVSFVGGKGRCIRQYRDSTVFFHFLRQSYLSSQDVSP